MKRKLYSVYQPILNLRTGKVMGYEALTRGEGKKGSPEILFREAYEKGSSIHLDLACLYSALRVLPKLKKHEFLFVNVEPTTLSRAFVHGEAGHFLLKRITAHGQQIVFELTEGMKGRDFTLVRKAVKLLRKYHCRFALDDIAGIGFKLFRLLSLKPDFMKIDISLVKGISDSHLHRELVHRLLVLGRRHNSLIVAEGLEYRRDVDLVRKMGIPFVQGFYFARPKKNLSKS